MRTGGRLSRLPVRVVEQGRPRSSSPDKGGVLTICPKVSGYPRSIEVYLWRVRCPSSVGAGFFMASAVTMCVSFDRNKAWAIHA